MNEEQRRNASNISSWNTSSFRINHLGYLLKIASESSLMGDYKREFECYKEIVKGLSAWFTLNERKGLVNRRRYVAKKCTIWNPEYKQWMKDYFPDGKKDTYNDPDENPFVGRKKKLDNQKLNQLMYIYVEYINQLMKAHGLDMSAEDELVGEY